jgi:hypothetical protein
MIDTSAEFISDKWQNHCTLENTSHKINW